MKYKREAYTDRKRSVRASFLCDSIRKRLGDIRKMQDFVKMRGSDMIIFVPEELDHHGTEKIRREADQLMGSRRVKQVIFDFRETVFMDSAGIGMIMGRYKLMQSLGGKVTAIHVNQRVRRILLLSGIYKIVGIYEDTPQTTGAMYGGNRHGV